MHLKSRELLTFRIFYGMEYWSHVLMKTSSFASAFLHFNVWKTTVCNDTTLGAFLQADWHKFKTGQHLKFQPDPLHSQQKKTDRYGVSVDQMTPNSAQKSREVTQQCKGQKKLLLRYSSVVQMYRSKSHGPSWPCIFPEHFWSYSIPYPSISKNDELRKASCSLKNDLKVGVVHRYKTPLSEQRYLHLMPTASGCCSSQTSILLFQKLSKMLNTTPNCKTSSAKPAFLRSTSFCSQKCHQNCFYFVNILKSNPKLNLDDWSFDSSSFASSSSHLEQSLLRCQLRDPQSL